ncbi:hypothetical protein RAMDARK_0411 [Rickettsia amblyommatis str. Darkwater]|uniref:Uncharacterized protein n=1 Tax=Rickettsia amblyommatis str. Ac/Pa TaxID=1359164 RepID=A0A0F3N0V4_RICAM|nr:hypothetical protein APHACPA_0639 [Rickettsia amblyommatis str. Ac/Pa]KJV97499.1 hypothetical protein RAMDARK_0411 [Rickettsia amblyommatis str. Darkwater]
MRGNYKVIDEAISGELLRLPRSLQSLAMTIRYLRNDGL